MNYIEIKQDDTIYLINLDEIHYVEIEENTFVVNIYFTASQDGISIVYNNAEKTIALYNFIKNQINPVSF